MSTTSIAMHWNRLKGPRRPPGPVGLPILGPMWAYQKDPLGFMVDATRRYGDLVFTRFAGFGAYLVNDPDAIEYVLLTNRANYEKSALIERFRPVLGDGLLTSAGPLWTRQRKLLAPAFHHRRVQSYVEAMTEVIDRHVHDWTEGRREITEDMMRLTLDIAVRTLFGVTSGNVGDRVGRALTTVIDYFAETLSYPVPIPLSVPTPQNRRFLAARDELFDVVQGIIRDKRRAPDGDDLLSMLLGLQDEDGRGMDDKQLQDEVLTLLLAGHETTALTLTYTFDLLARHPEEARAMHEQIDRVLEGRVPKLEDLSSLVRVEQVVKESMRLFPPAATLIRQAQADDELLGWPIPKGSLVVLPQWVTHRDPRWFEDPETFRPARWTKALEDALPRYAYFPFGGGPRVCIGSAFAMLEARLAVAMIAQRFTLDRYDDRPLDLLTSITVRPRNGLHMRVRPRA